MYIFTGKDPGPDPEGTGAGTAAERGGGLETGDSLAPDPGTRRETGDPRTERRKKTVILRSSQESLLRILQQRKKQRMGVKMDPTRVLRMVRRTQVPLVLKSPRRVIRRSLSLKMSLRSKRKMTEWLRKGITDLTREIRLSLKMRTRRMTGDLAQETGGAPGTEGHGPGVVVEVEGGLALETEEGATGEAGAGAEIGEEKGAGSAWRGSARGRGGSGNTGGGKRGSRGRGKTGGGGSARGRGRKKR